ncbi:uncharacterized protein EAF02_010861 [Botrytis sinoallii]|uniref:uncharacterized protein n=1 Tax=Botrytis sinoallii TaxID=1463999 RepID=UPI0018FF54BF|nr:uncharacterized protein EAF02_010861 [Botrytis sinoallii]KAF7860627.1 hypothetical protein EAF02_010861 [Botrytis sinoallii]
MTICAEMILIMGILVRASVGGWAMLGGREPMEMVDVDPGSHQLKTRTTLAQQHSIKSIPIGNPAVNVEGG